MASNRMSTVTSTPAVASQDDLAALEAQFGPFESIDPDRARYTAEFATSFPALAGLLDQARGAAAPTAA